MKQALSRLGKRNLTFIIIAIVIVVGGVAYGISRSGKSQYQFVNVTKGSISETVSVTGNTTPVQSLDLAFESGGTIAAVNADVGARVTPGETIVRLDTRDLEASRAQAQAQVDSEQAKLQSLQAGPQPADVQASQAALAKAQQDLTNFYGNVPNALTSAFAEANDAIRNQLAPFFANSETASPRLTFTVTDSQTLNNMQAERLQASAELNAWQTELAGITSASPTSSLEDALRKGSAHLTVIGQLLTTASAAVLEETGLDAATVNSYKSAVTNGITETNTGSSNVNALGENIASQAITVRQLQAQLQLKLAGSTSQDIAAQQAQVEAAQANLQSINVKLAKASLVSPISGIITTQNGKVGQIAAPSSPIVSIISDSNLEVDAEVPETDSGKIAIGNPVSMTFDAFQNETFTGKIFYIDPAPTIVQGVVDFKIKVNFDKPDPRIKSGLTANLDIQTQTKNDAFILPQFAVLQNDSGTFVEVLNNGSVAQMPVTLGIHDSSGNVEIASGVTEGEQVLNIGLKQ